MYQARSVDETLAAPDSRSWVVRVNGTTGGFVVAAILDPSRGLGEIRLLAVDPSQQGRGLGLRLTEHATVWLRDVGMGVAMIGTGGDPGHAAARRLYEAAGYALMPMARYFRAL